MLLLLWLCGSSQADTPARPAEADALARKGDFAPAWCIWQALAEQGSLEARYNLGWLYHNGQGVASDDRQARILWQQAAEQGHAEAQMALGMLYRNGRSIEPDPAQAVQWFAAAAGQGIEDALLILLDEADKGNPQAADAVARLVRAGDAGTRVLVRVDEANVRSKPSTRERVLASLPAGTPVQKLAASGDWWLVWVESIGATGWMYHALFE